MSIITINLHIHADPGDHQLLSDINERTKDIMSAISDFAAKQDAHNAAISTAIDGISGDVAELKRLIEELQNSAGQISPEDQATLDRLEAAAAGIETKVKALDDMTPPATPQG